MEVQSLCSNAVVLDSIFLSTMENLVAETAIVLKNSITWYLFMMEFIPNAKNIFDKELGTFGRFPFSELYAVKKPGPENKDGSDTEDDEEDDDEDAADDQDEDAGEDEDGSDEEGDNEGDPEDEPAANGDNGSGDEEDDDEEDEEADDDDEEEEEEEDEEDEEEIPQPPAKKRK
ncbi:phosphopantothenoylcysteine decarboxylase subunit SIS2-like [Mangifera indica]|uniref:phosphopantothenoylcysteine decarboxylase subunit SIS2-like n=1 Tax=Mangifera indica TaxID=29780 RepID=UPI001CFB47B8|nr:phosphopantothenoylcysteine decarboxylase subunit SIS2-like [Mangifera indica]